ncbi:MAG: MBL fold metallo-hydrolase [Candidatus Rokubacteria bacterium]|nr:MBL fold metallo-hydrolase [Candidatus Rokubacteria bacterium]
MVFRRLSPRLAGVLALLLVMVFPLALDVRAGSLVAGKGPSHHLASGFRNPGTEYSYTMLHRAKRLFTGPRRAKPTVGVAPLSNDGAELRANGQSPTVTWVGHSTFLVQLDGVNILTDPHWGDTTSPVRFAGPRRIVRPGLAFEHLPRIHAVVISHDHYDHLDDETVRRLAREHDPRFFVPLGLKAWLADRGITNVVEMDWWEERAYRGVTFVCTPAQHSSGRTFRDQNMRLWSSWVAIGRDRKMFFAGDTGYTPALKEIGKLGPFDLALVPVGGYSGYEGRHHPNHVNPEEAVQLFEDVGGRLMVPMHWGTFDLNREPANEPPGRVLAEGLRRGLEERIAILSPGQSLHW